MNKPYSVKPSIKFKRYKSELNYMGMWKNSKNIKIKLNNIGIRTVRENWGEKNSIPRNLSTQNYYGEKSNGESALGRNYKF